MNQNFVKEYLYVLFESQGKIDITVEEYKIFLETAVKFDENLNVILENENYLIDIPEDLITFLLENKHSFINGENIKWLLKESRHWRNIKNIKISDVYFDIFDFENVGEIDRFNYNCFKIEKNLNSLRELFLTKCSKLFGFYNALDNISILCINSKAIDIHQTLHHELSHLIQNIGNIRIVNGLNLNEVKNKDILFNNFKIKTENVIAYFSDKEFVPHVDDLMNDLKKCRKMFYSNLNGIQFRRKILDFVNSKNSDEMEENDLFRNFWKMNHGEVSSLSMLLYSKKIGYKFQKILNYLREVFVF